MIDTLVALIPVWLIPFVLLLAAFRVTRLITQDTVLNGPRNWLWSKFPPSGTFMDGGPDDLPPNVTHAVFQNSGRGTEARWYIEDGHWLGDLTICAWCTGFWVSLAATIIYGLFPTFALLASIPYALSAGVGLIASHQG